MSYFEEEYKQRFSGAQSTEGIDPDQIWRKVSAGLSDSGVPSGNPEKERTYQLLWWCLLLLAGGALSYSLLFRAEQPSAAVDDKKTIAKEEVFRMSVPSPTASVHSPQAKELTSAHATKKIPPLVSATHTVADQVEGDASTSASRVGVIENSIAGSEANTGDVERNTALLKNITTLQTGSTAGPAMPAPNKHASMAQLSLNSLSKPLLNPLSQDFTQDLLPAITPLQKKTYPWSVGLSAGTNVLFDYYQKDNQAADLPKTLKAAHKGEPGFVVAFDVRWQAGRNFHLTGGVEYISTVTEFNTVQQYDTVMFRDNIPGGELIDALATRTVRQHNRQSYLSVPLLAGFTREYNHFRIGIDMGIGLNFMIDQKGKSLNYQNEIRDYTSASANLPYPKRFLSYQFHPFVQYQWSERMAIRLRPSFRLQDHGRSDFFGLRHSTLYSGVSVGVFYLMQ